ncbi:MAG: hypothetical protein NZ926_02555 [Candidatus Methanomethylicia archaeon]|nr:hypothetical protein [Candidatus Methanomethylicia archaeon]MCX8169205.1 hypothetical protein [Candidatus Methanomethylicia archaeon]MDW7989013.1 hypothetical protein [Nitrososphaerota archaeon]
MVRICPECGGEMYYNRKGAFVCVKCGLSISKYESIKAELDKENLKDEKEKKKEYLKWWLSSKK